ncbi:MAG: hypothetical protein LBM75_10210 [Myxococcales bacterium]|nr:hypothetical protein [Myxococcales bacterium]
MSRSFIVLIAALLFVAGCDCAPYKCGVPRAVEICAIDAQTNEPINDFSVEWIISENEREEFESNGLNCRVLYHNNPQQFSLIIRAQNYADMELNVQVDEDTCDRLVGERREVALSRQSADSKVSKAVQLDGC